MAKYLLLFDGTLPSLDRAESIARNTPHLKLGGKTIIKECREMLPV